MLANNKLTSFTGRAHPSKNLASLELVRLANNDLQALPDEVLRAPRLAWVALPGTRGSSALANSVARSRRRWPGSDFSDAVALGKGASGSVRSASYRGTPCAVKGLLETSSRTAPRDELAVHERVAGETPSTLIKTLAVIKAPPAVVMERLTRNARDLARPPTIIEVTRDRYEDGERFSSAFSITLLKGLAEALRYLHSERVAHGSLRPANTLVLDSTGAAKLGDFGASFYYGELAPSAQKIVERVEVRVWRALCARGRGRGGDSTPLLVADTPSRATRRRRFSGATNLAVADDRPPRTSPSSVVAEGAAARSVVREVPSARGRWVGLIMHGPFFRHSPSSKLVDPPRGVCLSRCRNGNARRPESRERRRDSRGKIGSRRARGRAPPRGTAARRLIRRTTAPARPRHARPLPPRRQPALARASSGGGGGGPCRGGGAF